MEKYNIIILDKSHGKSNKFSVILYHKSQWQETLDSLSVSRMAKRQTAGLNNKGVIEIGPAQSFVFPPPNTPKAVKKAWDKATASLTDQQKALAKTAFLELQLKANTHMTPEGEVKIVFPGEPEYRNVFANNNSDDYLNLIDEATDILNMSVKYNGEVK